MRRQTFWLATIVLLAFGLSCARSMAQVRLSGTQDYVVMQANDATIPEILAALRWAFDLEVKLQGDTARKFTGVYSGSVRKVLSRLLIGNDYVLRSGSEGISIVLIGSSEAVNPVEQSGSPPAATGSRMIAMRQARSEASNRPK